MNIEDLLTAMRAANAAVNHAQGFFSHGRIEDVSLDFDKVNRDEPTAYLIYLLPVRGVDNVQAATTTYSCTVGFFKQDSQDSIPSDEHITDSAISNPLNRETIIEETEDLMRRFMAFLSNYSNDFTIRSWTFAPKYRDLQGTYTGHAVAFDIITTFDTCEYETEEEGG